MKKLLMGLALVGSVFMFQGCDESDILTPEQKAELLSVYYPDIFDAIKGDDGDSAYQVAVDNGFEGTVDEWLQSLVGADGEDGTDGIDGVDGVCPDCNITIPIEPPVCDNPFELDDNDTDVHVMIWTNRVDLERYTFFKARLEGGFPQSIAYTTPGDELPFMIGEDENTTYLHGVYGFEDNNTDTWGIGLEFDQFQVEVEQPIEEPEEEDPVVEPTV